MTGAPDDTLIVRRLFAEIESDDEPAAPAGSAVPVSQKKELSSSSTILFAANATAGHLIRSQSATEF